MGDERHIAGIQNSIDLRSRLLDFFYFLLRESKALLGVNVANSQSYASITSRAQNEWWIYRHQAGK